MIDEGRRLGKQSVLRASIVMGREVRERERPNKERERRW